MCGDQGVLLLRTGPERALGTRFDRLVGDPVPMWPTGLAQAVLIDATQSEGCAQAYACWRRRWPWAIPR